ncbi:hypothetical protein HYW75_02745 [Candidatus Pacearchaeota archaeon]|nr:hypothetical protein [Candidatus Pacearchaeota archaeon]
MVLKIQQNYWVFDTDKNVFEEGSGEKRLEDALSEWGKIGFGTRIHRDAPGKDGKWGGTLHYLSIERTSRDRLYIYIDFGSIENYKGAVTELKRAINNSGYKVSSGKLNEGAFFIRRVH